MGTIDHDEASKISEYFNKFDWMVGKGIKNKNYISLDRLDALTSTIANKQLIKYCNEDNNMTEKCIRDDTNSIIVNDKVKIRESTTRVFHFSNYVVPDRIDVYNNRTVKVTFADNTFTTVTDDHIHSEEDKVWIDTGVMLCLAKRYIAWTKDSHGNNFLKLADLAFKNNAERLKAEKARKYAEAERKAIIACKRKKNAMRKAKRKNKNKG